MVGSTTFNQIAAGRATRAARALVLPDQAVAGCPATSFIMPPMKISVTT